MKALRTVAIFGAGKVGAALARELPKAGVKTTLRAAREGLPEHPYSADVLVVAVRDRTIPGVVEELLAKRLVGERTVVVHCAGALSSEVLAPLRPVTAGVAQMHPMIAFASKRFVPSLRGGHAHVEGDPEGVRRARKLCDAVGLKPRTFPGLDTVAYHAGAGLVANGAAALAAAGLAVFERAGVPRATIPKLVGPLLRSVAENVEALGLPEALTGPVRRGEAKGVAAHLETIRRLAPQLVPLYVAMARAQVPLAREIGDAPAEAFDDIERVLRGG